MLYFINNIFVFPIFNFKIIRNLHNYLLKFNNFYMELKFKNYRNKNNLSQIQVATMLNIKQSSYSAYENGKSSPDLSTLAKIAEIFHTTIDELLGISNPNILVKSTLNKEELSIVDNIKNLTRDNLLQVEAYMYSKLEEQNKKT